MIGTRINNYEIMSLIGEGGMGTVYLARHPVLDRKAAIKVLREGLARDAAVVHRFFNEARAAAAIRHPHIIDVIDVGTIPGTQAPYLMMEFLEGESLAARIKRAGVLSPGEAIRVATQTASALAAAHAKGIIHRDLKPENLFLVPAQPGAEAGGEQVKVLDFGIAKLHGDLGGQHVRTQTGALMGTPPYMSPEQCRGVSSQIDARTDIYALGIILFEMLTGAPPFMGPGFGDILVMHLTQPTPSVRTRNPAISEALAAVVARALAKQADERFASMADLARALAAAAAVQPGPVDVEADTARRTTVAPVTGQRPTTTFTAAATSVEELLSPPGARSRRAWFAGAGAALSVGLILWAMARPAGLPAEAPPAKTSAAKALEPDTVARTPEDPSPASEAPARAGLASATFSGDAGAPAPPPASARRTGKVKAAPGGGVASRQTRPSVAPARAALAPSRSLVPPLSPPPPPPREPPSPPLPRASAPEKW